MQEEKIRRDRVLNSRGEKGKNCYPHAEKKEIQ